MKISIAPNWETLDVKVSPDQKDCNVFHNESISVVVYGYPYFCEKDKWLFSSDVYEFVQNNNDSFIHEIDGIYSIVVIDKSSKSAKIITDRYGIYALFYTKLNGGVVIADNFEEITEDFSELLINTTSVIEYLNFGYKLGDKTHFKDINKFGGATIHTFNEQLDNREEKYWDLLDVSENEKISREEFWEIFNEHFRKAGALEKRISLPLTGGRDSRVILSACIADKDKFHCYTHGPKYHTDVKQAKIICENFGITHKHYKIDDKFGKKLLEKAKNNSGFLYGQLSFLDYLHVKNSFEKESQYGDLLLTGVLGNQLYRHHPLGGDVPESGDNRNIAKYVVENVPSVFFFRTNLLEFYNDLFKDVNSKEISDLLIDSVVDVFSKTDKANKPIDLTRHFLLNTYASNVSNNNLRFTGKYFKLIGAFFHKDLLKQFKFMDIKEMTSAGLHNYIIDKNDKYLSELAYYNSGRVVKYLKLICNKVSTRLFKRTFFKHPELAHYHFWIKKYHREFLVNLLDYNKMVSAPLFNRDGLEKILNTYLASKIYLTSKKKLFWSFSVERLMINLISFEMWLKDISKGKAIRFVKMNIFGLISWDWYQSLMEIA